MLWLSTSIANLALLFAIIRTRAWKRMPLFVAAQVAVCLMSAGLLWAYYSPHVSQDLYHSAWMWTDQLCILIEAIAAWDLFGKNDGLTAMAWLTTLQALGTLIIYAMDDNGSAYPAFRSFLDVLDVFAVFGLACFVYFGDEVIMTAIKHEPIHKPKPKEDDLGTGASPTKPPPPPPSNNG